MKKPHTNWLKSEDNQLVIKIGGSSMFNWGEKMGNEHNNCEYLSYS